MSLKKTLERIASQYQAERQKQFAGNKLARFIRQTAKRSLNEKLKKIGKYKVDSSVGITQWALCPWIAILNTGVTTSAKKGFYVVYLFNIRDRRIYLSLNQGVSDISHHETSSNKDVLRLRASLLSMAATKYIDKNFTVQDQRRLTTRIDLGWRGKLPILYETGHVTGFEYLLPHIPADEDLWRDLEQLLRVYDDLVEQGMVKAIGADQDESRPEGPANGDDVDGDDHGPQTIIEILRRKVHKGFERRRDVSDRVKAQLGFRCNACEKSMDEVYGSLGEGYIEAHHKKPLHTLDEGVPEIYDINEDFAVLCPNCHRMIHRHSDPTDIAHIREVVRKNLKSP